MSNKIVLRIGAVLDDDLEKILFDPLVSGSKRAKKSIAKEMGGVQREQEQGVKASIQHRLSLERQAARAASNMDRERFREAAAQRTAQHRSDLAMQRELAREQRRNQEASARDSARRTFGGVASRVRDAVSRGVGFAGDVARGAGVSFDTGSMVRDFVTRQRMAVDLSNASFQEGGKGQAGIRQSPAQLMAEAAGIAQDTALDPTKVMEGLQKFVGKTGDLQGARDSLRELAILSQATGTDISNMVDAAGDAFANLGDSFKTGEDKARAVVDVMKALSGQGKMGAVEIKDMAVQMAGLASIAGSFEGDRAQNMALLGAIAQEARQRGGAKSASQAVGSVQSLMGTFGKKARLKELEAKGVDVFTDSSKTQVKDIQSIIVSAISKTRGSIPQMNKLFMDVQAQRAVRGFASVYSEKYAEAKAVKGTSDEEANKKAVAAVNEEFRRLKGATMKNEEIQASFAAKMETAEAKAQKFQNQLQTITDAMATKLLPELERIGPDVARAFGKMTDMASWAVRNPYQAAGAVAGVAVLKAGTEAVLSKAVEAGMGKVMAAGLGSMMGMGALSITAAAVTLYAMHELNQIDKEKKKTAGETTDEMLAAARKIEGQFSVARGKEQTAQLAIDEEMAKPEDQRDAKRLADAQKQKAEAKARQEELAAQADDLSKQFGGDLQNVENVKKAGSGPLSFLPGFGIGALSWASSALKSVGADNVYTANTPGRRDVANAEATEQKLDEVKAAVDGLSKVIGAGLVIKSLPAGALPLPSGKSTTGIR